MMIVRRAAILLAFFVAAATSRADDVASAESLEVFEKQVRPLLIQHCHECHGDKKQEAGLRLDTRSGFLKGSESGPVFVTGNVDGSRLFQVLKYVDGQTQMPPKAKLADEQIATIRKWLEMGAAWPADVVSDTASAAKRHWSFQPVQRPEIPVRATQPLGTKQKTSAIQSPVDAFIVAALSAKSLDLSSPADRYTFIRRVTIDLWGIPPTSDQVNEFTADPSPDSFERLVDRLLASPLYGQRWGRHWLDVARYADSKGYVFTAEPRYPYSYTYRDYVIDAFNSDTPFDEFVIEQLAADQVFLAGQQDSSESNSQDPRLAAMGFLTVGRRYVNNVHDIIDDRIDVVSRGLLGLTVGCSRCHDHKFDPIPAADYYSLYGVFSSSTEPDDLPVIGVPKDPVAYQAYQGELAVRVAAVSKFESESVPKVMDEVRERAGDSLQLIAKQIPIWAPLPVVLTGSNEPRPPIVRRWQDWLNRAAGKSHPVFETWHGLAKVAKPEDFAADVAKLIESWSKGDEAAKVNPLVRQAIAEQKPGTMLDVARLYGKLLSDVQGQWNELKKSIPEASQLPDAAAEQLRQILYGNDSPAHLSLEEARPAFGRDIRDKITNLKRNVDALKVTSIGAPPRAMVLRDGPIQDPVIFVRGNPGRHGQHVPRQFLGIASGSERKPFEKGSGRLELAQAIVDPRNPLTSRVIVNRVWQHHFGTGIVTTPSDFGTRGQPPSHPELLDWLAAEIVEIGTSGARRPAIGPQRWSIKSLHRLIVNSSVYRQASTEDALSIGIDPENRLLWRMPRQRLDFESLRDSMLAVSGKLDNSLGGQPFDGVMNPSTTRRTVYTLINRNDLPGVFRAFDFADIDSSAAERPRTTVPQQSLFAMNAPFVLEQSRRLSSEGQSAALDNSGRLQWLYRQVFSRDPTDDERALGLRFLETAETTPTEKLSPFDRLAQILLMTNEFSFVD